eukprot:scaffold118277_cov29-Tisochrysis_lutea.AAC.2
MWRARHRKDLLLSVDLPHEVAAHARRPARLGPTRAPNDAQRLSNGLGEATQCHFLRTHGTFSGSCGVCGISPGSCHRSVVGPHDHRISVALLGRCSARRPTWTTGREKESRRMPCPSVV